MTFHNFKTFQNFGKETGAKPEMVDLDCAMRLPQLWQAVAALARTIIEQHTSFTFQFFSQGCLLSSRRILWRARWSRMGQRSFNREA